MKKLTLFVCLLAASPLPQAVAQGQSANSQANKKYEQRRQTRIDDYRDETGRVRPDLWKKGIDQYRRMKVAAGIRRVPRNNGKNANDAIRAASVSAELNANGPVQGVQWKQLGPQPAFPIANINFQGNGPMSGEVLDIAIDPRGTSDQVIYIATNDGGIWKSDDGGVNFKPKTDFMPSLSMGAVALDPTAPWTVYAGSGNLFDGNGTTTTLAVKAVGVYKSVDMGESWTVLNPGGIFTGNGINRILVLPGNVVLVASANGLYRSVNGGLAFGNNSPLFDNGARILTGFISDLDLDVNNGNRIYASVAGSGVRVSTDGGETFSGNLFSGGYDGGTSFTDTAFIAFAQSESNPAVMYMNIQRASDGAFHGLYRSSDSGATWTRQAGADARAAENNGCQCGYDQTVGVDPLDANRVFIGFQELYVSTDGGANFGTPAVSRNKIHWDHHALVWSPPSHRGPNPTTVRLWLGTDGGVHSTTDNGGTFNNNHNATISTNLFTDIDIGRGSAANNAFTVGGTQDTGTLHKSPAVPVNAPSPTRWNMGINGDGGGVAIDPSNPNRMYGGGNNGYMFSNDGGQTWNPTAVAAFNNPPWRYAINRNDSQQIFAVVSTDNGGFRPGNQVVRTLDGGANWSVIATLPGNARAIANTPADPDLLWLGLDNGSAARITNATAPNPANVSVTTFPISGSVGAMSGVAINPLNSNDVVVTFRGVCGSCDGNPSLRQKRVYRTLNGGTTWTDISGTDGQPTVSLPNIPHHSVVFDIGTSPPAIIVSHDAGVNVSYNNGATWEKMGVGLPTADSKRLQIDDSVSPPKLRLGTYGRSVWELAEATGPIIAVNADLGFDALCAGLRSTRIVQVFNVGSEPLIVTSIFRVSGSADFSVISGPNTPVTLQPGDEVNWTIEFRATTPGAQSAVFQINSTDPNNPSVQVNASGVVNTQAIAAFIANAGSFGEVCTGSFKDLMLSIANVGCGTLSISNITSSNSSFVLPNAPPYPLAILAGTAMQIPVRFQPTTPGAKNANITISSNDPANASRVIPVSGTVGEPNIELSGSLSFGEVCIGGPSLEKVLTIRNSGTCNLTVSSVAFQPACPDFAVLDSFPRSVSPGSQTTATIKYTPTDEGSVTCNLRVQSNDPDTPSLDTPVSATLPPTLISATPNSGLVFLPEVVQSTGACSQTTSFSFTNQGKCPVRVESASAAGADYSFTGLPALPLNLQRGQSLGENNLLLKFAPLAMDRDVLGTVTVNYVSNAATGAVAALSRTACGEGVRTGARILVRVGGVPFASVEKLQLQRITANRNGKGTNVESIETAQNLVLQTVNPDAPCGLFQYHREYGTPSNPVQLLTGSYQVTATIVQGNKRSTKTVSFSVDTCDFNPQVIVNF